LNIVTVPGRSTGRLGRLPSLGQQHLRQQITMATIVTVTAHATPAAAPAINNGSSQSVREGSATPVTFVSGIMEIRNASVVVMSGIETGIPVIYEFKDEWVK